MKTQKLEFIVGVFVLAGILLGMGLTVFFGKVVTLGRKRYEVSAIFYNVHGMAPGTPVRHLGIDIGELKQSGFTEKGDKVKLVLSISAEHDLPADAKIRVRPTGILGDFYLEFSGGTPGVGHLGKDGSAVVEGEPMVTIDEIASQLVEFTAKLEHHIDALGANLTKLSGSLNEVIGDEEFQKNIKQSAAEVPDAVRAFKEMTQRIAAVAGQADDLVKQGRALLDKTAAQVDHQGDNMDQVAAALAKTLNTLNETLGSLDEILLRFRQGKGTIGALIEKDEVHEKLVKTIDRMNETLEQIRKMVDSIRRRWG